MDDRGGFAAGRDVYVCPEGEDLRRDTRVYKERVIKHRADPAACDSCALKSKCTASSKGRLVSRGFDEGYLEKVRSYHGRAPYEKAMRRRRVWVEPMFAEAPRFGVAGASRAIPTGVPEA